jgi:hypothetical protein
MAKNVNYGFENCDVDCDNKKCKSYELIDSCDYSDVNKEIKDMGWIIKKIDGNWYDFCCEECYKNFSK